MSALQWELDWVGNHVHLYEGPAHAEAVKRNIEKRYEINRLNRQIVANWKCHKMLVEMELTLERAYPLKK